MTDLTTANGNLPAPTMVVHRPALVPANMGEAIQLAELMARCNLVPKDLQKKPADCLMIIQLAVRWEMDPFAVAQECSVIQGKLMPSGKLTAAVVNSRGNLAQRLSYRFDGDGDDRTIRVSGLLRGESQPRTVDVILRNVRTTNKMWTSQPDQQLMYSGARIWARRHVPELMLGVWAPEEFDEQPKAGVDQNNWPTGSLIEDGDYAGGTPEKLTKPKEEPKYTRAPSQQEIYDRLCDDINELIRQGISLVEFEHWGKENYGRRMTLKGSFNDAFNRFWMQAHKIIHDNWVAANGELTDAPETLADEAPEYPSKREPAPPPPQPSSSATSQRAIHQRTNPNRPLSAPDIVDYLKT